MSFQSLKGMHFLSSAIWGEAQLRTTKLPKAVNPPPQWPTLGSAMGPGAEFSNKGTNHPYHLKTESRLI